MSAKLNNKNGGLVARALPPPLLTIDNLQVQKETQIVNEQKILDKGLVAGLVKKSNRILYSISTHKFPFDFFPDTLNIEEGRITVIIRNSFFSSDVHSVDVADISNIFINLTPFFAQLVIVSKTFAKNEIKIRNLFKDEAIFTRRLVEGLRIFAENQIDTSKYTKEELILKLKELSKTKIVV
ncbi:MAG: hypothetical protein PHX84_03140 [Candidatus Shapirobacteria bacterium]|nr:hypothetical protein [Candidatus Shapirobacteria bacterium]